jgi:hypothetical protein
MHSLMAAMLLGIDSLVVSAALSPMFKLWSPGWRLAFAFGACDAVAFLIGSAFSWGAWARDVAEPALPAAVLAYGLYVLAAARWRADRRGLRASAMLGLASGALSLLGLAAGNALFSRLARLVPGSAGPALIAASFLILVAR